MKNRPRPSRPSTKGASRRVISTRMDPDSGFHRSQSHGFNHDLHVNNNGREEKEKEKDSGPSPVCLQRLSPALNLRKETVNLIKNKPGKVVYGTKKTRDTRKAKKRCVDGCDMYIVRVKKETKEWAMSRPCRDCWEVLHTLGIRKVYYTTAVGTWMCEKVATMETTHRSSGVLTLQAYRQEERKEKKRERKS